MFGRVPRPPLGQSAVQLAGDRRPVNNRVLIFWNGFVILEEVDVTSIIQYCGEARYEPTKQSSSRKGLL